MLSTITDVVVLHWPDDENRRAMYRERHMPMLWIVAEGTVPPPHVDILEDWARSTADAVEIQARLASLSARAQQQQDSEATPSVDENGIVRWNGAWVSLGPIEAKLAAALLDRMDQVVSRADLSAAGWPGDVPTSRALDVQLLRLRRHLEPLRIRIENIRGHGYVAHPL